MPNQLLDYFAETHSGYLHARGKVASHTLIGLLDCQANENILEIGCGTGSTLVKMAATYPDSKFQGLDASEIMLRFAQGRLKFCGLTDRIQLTHSEAKSRFPFEDHSFDRVYVESVLAIQEGDDLETLLRECQRVLKPGGTLVFNETIWLDSTPKERAQEINEACISAFGIIQANAKYPHLENWKELLLKTGLKPQKVIRVADIGLNSKPKARLLPLFRSRLYSLKGSLRAKTNSTLRQRWDHYQQEMRKILPDNTPLMEGVIVKVTKAN